jgi:hypothetical protein
MDLSLRPERMSGMRSAVCMRCVDGRVTLVVRQRVPVAFLIEDETRGRWDVQIEHEPDVG